jgi:hypothetical protein
MTRLLLTKIPFFREIIVSSFSCEHCGWNNTEIQSAGRIQDQGVRYTLTVRGQEVRGARRDRGGWSQSCDPGHQTSDKSSCSHTFVFSFGNAAGAVICSSATRFVKVV